MTMSIAFITLILGFLLGKFTSDRNHLIKENYKRQQEVNYRPQATQNEVDLLINSVIDAVREKLSTSSTFKEQLLKEEGGKKIAASLGRNFTSCLNEFAFESEEEDLEDFLKHLLRTSYNFYVKCAKELKSILLIDNNY